MPPGTSPDAAGPGAGGRHDPLAVASLVLGLCSLPVVFCFPLAVFFSVGGIVCGIVALVRARPAAEDHRGRGLAVSGIILSLIGPFVLAVLFVVSLLPALSP
jgi:hypothetical protein